MKKQLYITPETTTYQSVPGNCILAVSLPKIDEEEILEYDEILAKPNTPPSTPDIWEDEEEEW